CDYSFKFFPGEEFSADHTIFTEPEQREQQLLWINALGEIFKSIAPPELILRPVEFPLSSDTPGIELLEELLYGFCRRLCAEGDTAGSWVIKKIRLAVQDRKGSAISVEECAEKLNCSTGHLRTLVKQETGSTTKEIIDRERIKIIRQLLVYSNISISEMAKKTGFSDVIYFERFFKKYCGETPRIFRKRSKENIL
ncbi:MAG: helix-turn-helix transcriptional regulator, partial [Lentisphaeria bacterium]|nr:helix-turn-helix transcriptional regulator [Lentisphaeria bacterium]